MTAPSSDKQQAAEASASSSNEPSSPFEYIPITALDNYGQSTQLRHAMESATRFGTPVLACICRIDSENKEEEKEGIENAIVVCSLQRPRPGVISSSPTIRSSSSSNISSSNNKSIIHPSIQGMVKPVATRDDIQTTPRTHHLKDIPNHAIHTAIVTTGISSDANFLLAQLQSHISKYRFRYDALPSTSGATSSLTVIKMVRDVLLDCMGYDWSEELASAKVSGGIGSAAPSYDDQEGDEDRGSGGQRAGRPLGVCTFLLGLDYSTAAHPFLTVIKANGSSQQYVAHAMGAGSQLANDKLSQRWKRCMSEKEAKDMMREILNDVAKETGWLPGDENDGRAERNGIDGLTVACETVTSGGIDVEYLPL